MCAHQDNTLNRIDDGGILVSCANLLHVSTRFQPKILLKYTIESLHFDSARGVFQLN